LKGVSVFLIVSSKAKSLVLSQVDPKYVRNLKFTKKHNSVARKKLLKIRTAKLAGAGSAAAKAAKRAPVKQTELKKSSWSLGSLLKNVTAYFTGETIVAPIRKRVKRTHTSKKALRAKAAAATAAKPVKTTTTTPASTGKK
jgi:hypothetical protein